jgi:hypothetical protein
MHHRIARRRAEHIMLVAPNMPTTMFRCLH